MARSARRVTVTNSATLLTSTDADNQRGQSITVRNTDASVSVFLGGSGVTATTGFELVAGDSFSEDDFGEALYGVTASASVRCDVMETGI